MMTWHDDSDPVLSQHHTLVLTQACFSCGGRGRGHLLVVDFSVAVDFFSRERRWS